MANVEVLPTPPAQADGGNHHPFQKPRPAATLILLDHSQQPVKVLMGRRHASHKFMPGKFVFPGGRIEPDDRLMPAARELQPIVAEKLMKQVSRPAGSRGRALALAAIRETFEETGLLLGTIGAPQKPLPTGVWTRFGSHGVLPDLADLHFIARAITPPGRPRRFDTHFFCADATTIAHRIEDVVTAETELVELVWIALADARGLDLPMITHTVLDELDKRVAAGMGYDLPVPFYHYRNQRWLREEL